MPRIQHLTIFACTVAFLLPACEPPDAPDASMCGPSDASEEPDDDPDDVPDPPPKPRRPLQFGGPHGHRPPVDADRPEDLVVAPHAPDTCPEPADHLDDPGDDESE
jgi:hypothetical protein